MTCVLCEKLSLGEISKLDDLISNESTDQLVERYQTSPERIVFHRDNCMVDLLSSSETLKHLQRALHQIAVRLKKDIDSGAYKIVDEDQNTDGRGLINNYVAVLREIRSNVMAANNLQNTEAITEAINEKIVAPIIYKTTTICIEEVRRLREDLFKSFQDTAHKKIDSLTKTSLKRIGERLENESVKDINKSITAVLDTIS